MGGVLASKQYSFVKDTSSGDRCQLSPCKNLLYSSPATFSNRSTARSSSLVAVAKEKGGDIEIFRGEELTRVLAAADESLIPCVVWDYAGERRSMEGSRKVKDGERTAEIPPSNIVPLPKAAGA